ncbi:TRAP transporter large permease [Paenibacillus alkalitolerans]|uniref:TRAP transporter large permease n=1 Tax=Paenibacillus alkalitolerans TaxID=2799335 RepID=UPI0018F5FA7D|nr:TRAP transporter large permease [Paenibacillus alkalitolerans]
MELLIVVAVLLILFFLGVPVAFSIMLSTLLYFAVATDVSWTILVQRMVSGVESIPLLAVLFFVAAGILMNYTGISKRMIAFSEVVTGHLPGGLAQVNILLSTLMGGLSGSNLADAAMQSKMLVPEMVKKGYSRGFSTAVTAAGSLITPIIPPGIAMIIYGYVGNVSIGKLFMAGVVPGILLCILMMITVHIISKRRGYLPERARMARPKEILSASKPAVLAFILPVAIIGGIRIGAFTPTEAGAVAVVFALFLGVVLYREMTWANLKASVIETVRSTASIMLIIAAASGLGWVLTWERIPQQATEWVTGLVSEPLLFLLLINLFLLVVGMFMEGNVTMIILVPLLMPMIQAYGIDPVHFGIVFILNLSIGTLTPPLGTIMFTTCSITGCKFDEFIKEVIPFWITLIIALLLLTFIPAITLWLPRLLMS